MEDVANLENDKYGKHEKYGEFLQKKVYGMNSVEVHVDIKRADIKITCKISHKRHIDNKSSYNLKFLINHDFHQLSSFLCEIPHKS